MIAIKIELEEIKKPGVTSGKIVAQVEDDSTATNVEEKMKAQIFQLIQFLGEEYYPQTGAATMVQYLTKEQLDEQEQHRS
jgi:hypothetical protein